MRVQLQRRLEQLRTEFAAGQQMIADFEAKQAELQRTLLRISGAIQVLEEELAKDGQTTEGREPRADAKRQEGLAIA